MMQMAERVFFERPFYIRLFRLIQETGQNSAVDNLFGLSCQIMACRP
jgi:hypothetical protein